MLISHYSRNVKKMRQNNNFSCIRKSPKKGKSSNVKLLKKYHNFGETIQYLTINELKQLFDCIDNYHHKLMFQIIYELGCRVGEFVRIQIKHLNFSRSTVFFPAENTKTKENDGGEKSAFHGRTPFFLEACCLSPPRSRGLLSTSVGLSR